MAPRITAGTLPRAIAELAARDPDLARAHAEAGVPPLRHGRPDFATLIRIICSQQVSTASTKAILGRLGEVARPLVPETLLALDEATLRRVGFSRQKISYARGLAADLIEGRLDLGALARLDDEAAIAELVKVRGIGRWTAEIYLLFALKRADVWPVDDLAVVVATQRLKGLAQRPSRAEMIEIGEPWRPWRSAAARLLWHYYRTTPGEGAG